MNAGLVILLVLGLGILYLSSTRDSRREASELRKQGRRDSEHLHSASEADEKFRKELESISLSGNPDLLMELAVAHLSAIRAAVRGLEPSAPLADIPDSEWFRDRIRIHAEIAGCSPTQLAHSAAECTLAFLDKAASDLRVFNDSLRMRNPGFNQYAEAYKSSPVPRNKHRAERLANSYVATFGDGRQKALLAELTE
jgi:hypothetical protein